MATALAIDCSRLHAYTTAVSRTEEFRYLHVRIGTCRLCFRTMPSRRLVALSRAGRAWEGTVLMQDGSRTLIYGSLEFVREQASECALRALPDAALAGSRGGLRATGEFERLPDGTLHNYRPA